MQPTGITKLFVYKCVKISKCGNSGFERKTWSLKAHPKPTSNHAIITTWPTLATDIKTLIMSQFTCKSGANVWPRYPFTTIINIPVALTQ